MTDHGMVWKLRRVAASLRQRDVAGRAGMSAARYGAFERGEAEPTDEDRRFIERVLPPLPACVGTTKKTET